MPSRLFRNAPFSAACSSSSSSSSFSLYVPLQSRQRQTQKVESFTAMVVSVWASFMASWFTPGSLFLLLNLTIGTIFLMNRFGTHRKNPHYHLYYQQQVGPHDSVTQLARAPSLLDRVKSINFSLYKFDSQSDLHYGHLPPEPDHVVTESPTQLVRTPSLLERLKSINLSTIYRSDPPEPETLPDPTPEAHDQGVKRSKSESGSEVTRRSEVTRMKKSKSAGAVGDDGEEDDGEEEDGDGGEEVVTVVERRRPATARVEKEGKKKKESKDSQQTTSFLEDDGVDAKADDFINRFRQQLRLQRLDSLKRFSEMWKGR